MIINWIRSTDWCSRFAEKLLKAAQGAKGLVEPSYIYLPGVPGGKEIAEKVGVDFFSVPVELGVCYPPPVEIAL